MKYKLLEDETTSHNGITLYRIQALKDFADVKTGDKGGWIEKESNLSQRDDAWVYCSAQVYGNARVSGNVMVYGNVWICGNALICGNSKVYYNENEVTNDK